MREIKAAVVTAKISEENKIKLNEMIGEERITYFDPFSYPEMLKMAAKGATKEEILQVMKSYKSQVRKVVLEKTPDVAILGADIDDSILASDNIKWIHCTHAGIEKSAKKEIFDRSIVVTSSAGRSAPALAEHAIMFILSLTYDINHIAAVQKTHTWDLGRQYSLRTGLMGKTVGIIGVGHNGCEIAKRLKGFDVRVLGYDRNVRVVDGIEEILDAHEKNLQHIAEQSDFLVLCVSLNNATYHMINEKILSLMKPSAYVINIARGGLIDEKALIKALSEHVIAGAALDTVEEEPLSADSSLWDMPNVLITPHTTPVIPDKEDREWEYVFKNVVAYQNEESFTNKLEKDDMFTIRKKSIMN